MKSSPAVSVLMSVWNGMPFVPLTVRSVLAQSFREFEFVIVDNCSSDGTRDFLTEAAASDSRLRLVFNERNLGHSGGLNRGLDECTGTWIARIDADDIALPTRLERQLAFVSQEPRLKVTSSLAHYIDANGRRVAKTYHDLKTPADFERYMAASEMIGLLHPGAFMDRQFVAALGGYREEFGAANDIDLWARVAEAGGMILVQQEYLMEYRIHPGQISAAKFAEARKQYEWCRSCAKARRAGTPPMAWKTFCDEWDSTPWPARINRWRKLRAKHLYRDAGVRFACGSTLGAVVEFAAAALLQPGYAFRRVAGQLSRT